VIFEALAARSLGLGILAIGVQARGGESYVVREQLDAGRPNVGEIIKELVILGCIERSYLDLENPTAIPNALDTDKMAALKQSGGRLIEMLQIHNPTLESVSEIDKLAEKLFESLQDKLDDLGDGVSLQVPRDGDRRPIELSNGELAGLLSLYDSPEIRRAADKIRDFQLKKSQ
jgi:hypothetical protein